VSQTFLHKTSELGPPPPLPKKKRAGAVAWAGPPGPTTSRRRGPRVRTRRPPAAGAPTYPQTQPGGGEAKGGGWAVAEVFLEERREGRVPRDGQREGAHVLRGALGEGVLDLPKGGAHQRRPQGTERLAAPRPPPPGGYVCESRPIAAICLHTRCQ